MLSVHSKTYDHKCESGSMMEVGRMCVKIAGRDAGKKCVIVEIVDKNTVLIDGETRRRKCSIRHLEPLNSVLKLKKGASHAEVSKEFSGMKLDARESKPRKAGMKPLQQRTSASKPKKEAASAKEEKKAKKK